MPGTTDIDNDEARDRIEQLQEELAKLDAKGPPAPEAAPAEAPDEGKAWDGIVVQVHYDAEGGLNTEVHVNGQTRITEIPFLLEVALAQFRIRTFGAGR